MLEIMMFLSRKASRW